MASLIMMDKSCSSAAKLFGIHICVYVMQYLEEEYFKLLCLSRN